MGNAPTTPGAHCPCALLRQVPVAFLLVDRDLRVIEGNDLFWRGICGVDPPLPGIPIEQALGADLLDGLRAPLQEALATGLPVEVDGLVVRVPGHPPATIDLHIAPGATRDQQGIIIASTAVSAAGQRVAELTLLHNMIRVLRRETQVDRVLFTVLTCATAGSGGMGFNRAWVLLVDPSGRWLEGRMALGPRSAEEAHRIWAEIASQPPRTLEELATAHDRWTAEGAHSLEATVKGLRFSMESDALRLPVLAAIQRKAITVHDAGSDERVSPDLYQALGAREFVAVPMVASGEPCGVIMADNLYSGAPITPAHARLLSLFAQHAGIAIEHAQLDQQMEAQKNELAQAYVSLKDTHRDLVRAKQLAAVGEMSARLAHDLRNPLATIGGWAEVLEEEPDDPATVRRAAGTIAELAQSMETILSMLLQPLGAHSLRLEATDLNELLRGVAEAEANKLAERGIGVTLDLAPELRVLPIDPAQFRRCILNLVDNAAHAMPQGGTLALSTQRAEGEVRVRVADTGVGMTGDMALRVFDAFVTTRHHGSGLGLAVVWDIIQAHGATVEVDSAPGQGAVFTIRFPVTQGVSEGAAMSGARLEDTA